MFSPASPAARKYRDEESTNPEPTNKAIFSSRRSPSALWLRSRHKILPMRVRFFRQFTIMYYRTPAQGKLRAELAPSPRVRGEGRSEGFWRVIHHVQSNAERSPCQEKDDARNTHTHTHTGLKRKTPALALTGQRQQGQFVVWVWGHKVQLTERTFLPLCELARARRDTEAGYVFIDRQALSLLRAAIDEQTGRQGLGRKLIQTGNYREYRLCDEAKDFVTDPSFEELPADLIDPELKRALCSGKTSGRSLKR